MERCQEIARKLDIYREDGLIDFAYRNDPNTPKQQVICAHTKKSGTNCPLVITLKPGADGYETLREMTTALHGGDGIYQNSDGTKAQISAKSPVINLSNFLSREDR
ncbi:MAG: COP23 domain-containing protein [Xenococcaceae cyanobacterium MO_167.B52]|nr:COP23 domain-containing protein [Xenococcaceae cyanobacterium MO_167.B52]